MARPFTRDQALENRAFLATLERTGNIRLAAREVGRSNATMHGRRHACPAFAQRWAVAMAIAQARLARTGRQGPAASAASAASAPHAGSRGAPGDARGHRTRGGEAVVVRRNDGKLQVRRAQPGKLTRECEQAFLAALSATCNVRLAAAAAGADPAAFYRRRRQHKGFAREMRLALTAGYERLEAALLETVAPGAQADDGWRHNEPPAMPAMTPNQALQLMYLHQKEARLLAEPAHLKRRRGESVEAAAYRCQVMYWLGQAREREKYEIAEAARRARGEASPFEQRPQLPALDQVTGWSRADAGKAPHHEGRALFGGWRVEDLGEG